MDEDRLKHSIAVARKMTEIGREHNLSDNEIKDFEEKNNKILTIDITNASEEEKKKLFIRGQFSAFGDFLLLGTRS
ncbi:MAG: hypothetical protein IKG14_05420 [Clostridia bacterium]|nr:hypothetical protein [Clostridia bacterium]